MAIESERPWLVTEFNNMMLSVAMGVAIAIVWLCASITKTHVKIDLSIETKGIWGALSKSDDECWENSQAKKLSEGDEL